VAICAKFWSILPILCGNLKNKCQTQEIFLNIYIKDISELIEDTVNTRNYLTHFDKKLEKKAKHGIDLYKVV